MALTDTFTKNTKHTGKSSGDKHTDGGGMYLLINPSGKYWRMDYRFADKRKTLALGVYPEVSLAKARQRREKAREQLADGIDPSIAKREEKQAKADAAAHTFALVARDWLTKTAAERAPTTQNKITSWLEKDVIPFIGAMPMSAIGPRDVLTALRKMEARGALDSVHRVKQVTGQVFRYAVAIGAAERDITQDLKGSLAKAAPSHFAAITEPKLLGDLLRSIFAYSGHPNVVTALRLTPLVFVRPGELRTMEWAEIDLETAEWRIPGAKMKMKTDHIVPLSTQALALLQDIHPATGHGKFVFPSLRTGERPMSENTINAALRSMGYAKEVHSAHGFRATARTIMDEVLGERVDLIEHQLAHAVKDVNGRAYNRTAHLPARREMMQRWADYLDKLRVGADVIHLKIA
ncbi:integrase arm-type DNA-binding domain-containing protein [Acidovorax sp. Be4]|uniref:Integrase arm-type DNA-binding domain-containing protein n=1 Tax=Acidovorax bellezanensis TaxID=2976702 RepID=A0ABT2PJ02_9BURK|nr:integrase arm-type DNA-binding domain-containing protein [Acidovorax sp. Be4]MCT9809779.1 integrase arm-type DNA-binding domain-containing protein [Acidovorax sp. Be4]